MRQRKTLLEARADRERFIEWGGEKLFDRFMFFKHRLTPPKNDMTWWASTKTPHEPSELDAILTELEAKQREKKKEKEEIEEGVDKLLDTDKWLVMSITTFEASQKYGSNTKWCISGKNMAGNDSYGNQYWEEYTRRGAGFIFLIDKERNLKYSVLYLEEDPEKFRIWNELDSEISSIPGAPSIPGFEEIDLQERNRWAGYEFLPDDDEDMEWDDEEDYEPPTPPPYTVVQVSMEEAQLLGFFADSIESAVGQYGAEFIIEVIQVPRGTINLIKKDDKFEMFFWDGRGGGPFLMGHPGNLSKLIFDDEEEAFAHIFATLAGVEVRHSEDPQEEDGPLQESYFYYDLADRDDFILDKSIGIRNVSMTECSRNKARKVKLEVKEEVEDADLVVEEEPVIGGGEEYWRNEARYQIEENLPQSVLDTFEKLSEEEQEELLLSVANNIINNEALWEEINNTLLDAIYSELGETDGGGDLEPEAFDDDEPEPLILEDKQNYIHVRFVK